MMMRFTTPLIRDLVCRTLIARTTACSRLVPALGLTTTLLGATAALGLGFAARLATG